MTIGEHERIREILRKHLEKAVEEIVDNEESAVAWWGVETALHMASAALAALACANESVEHYQEENDK